jgi:hypothetical protein
MSAVVGTLEGGGAVDAGEHSAAAPALVLVKLGLLDDVVAGLAVNCPGKLVFIARD